MTIEARPLTLADAQLLRHLAPGVFDDPINTASAAQFLRDPNCILVAALDKTKTDLVVGFASGHLCMHPDKDTPELFINEVGVAPAYQRRGVGKKVMTAMFAAGRAAGCRLAWLAVDEDNDAALGLYKAVGGKPPERQLHVDFDL